jgi:hypothetical protein
MKFNIFLLTVVFSTAVQAETGYVFEGDLNGDEIVDSIKSGPSQLFGNGGGPFIISFSNGLGGFIQKEIGLHPMAVALELVNGHPRIWSYWRMSCCEGELSITTLDEKFETQSITMYPGDTPDSPTLSMDVYNTVFKNKHLIEFKKVENYQVPPSLRGEWGK